MNKLSYSRFAKMYLEYNDLSHSLSQCYTKYLFGESRLCIDFNFTEQHVYFTTLFQEHAYNVKVPSDWLFLTGAELDTKLGLLTKDELFNYVY